MAEQIQDDFLLLDEEVDVDSNVDSSSFDFNLFQTDIVHSKKDESRKTRAGVNKTTTEPSKAVKEKGRVIKGTSVTKPVKRKNTKASDVTPAKCSKVATFSQNDISGLKDKMGISAMADSITTLSNMMKGFINKSENISSKKPRSETISQANKKVVNNTPSRPLLPLEPNLVDTDVMNEFDLEPYMDDSMPQSSDVDASPAHVFRGFW
jgi:hypothetical protein